jgi:hypothetical protein
MTHPKQRAAMVEREKEIGARIERAVRLPLSAPLW